MAGFIKKLLNFILVERDKNKKIIVQKYDGSEKNKGYHVKKLLVSLAPHAEINLPKTYLCQANVGKEDENEHRAIIDTSQTVYDLTGEKGLPYQADYAQQKFIAVSEKISSHPAELEQFNNAFAQELKTQTPTVNLHLEPEISSNFSRNSANQFLNQYKYSVVEIDLKGKEIAGEKITVSEQALASSILANTFIKLSPVTEQDNVSIAKVTLGCDYNGNDFKLPDVTHALTNFISLVNTDSIYLDLQGERVKSIYLEVIKREFKHFNTKKINNLIREVVYRDLQGSQYIGEQAVFLRVIANEQPHSKLHLVCLKQPCIYKLSAGLKAKYIFILFVQEEEKKEIALALPTLIKKAQVYVSRLQKNGCPTDVEEVWKDLADVDWEFSTKSNK
ncbi:hypothetical protein CJP74_06615 [Psittacicella melopsittaci]|uniref:Uncharacterized protein n=1 Tax=Psittacicella melopsittaci TaxID=2028576 RepID=A0A3A1Y384_9GAMM|nr:hypothetical protein [Psittacicella melopsittaci]RIY31668.1 hypothetical protein CJP74_06615 [Psittacicella melopsittaci]